MIVCPQLRTTARTSGQRRMSSGNLGLYRARRRAGAVLRDGHDTNIDIRFTGRLSNTARSIRSNTLFLVKRSFNSIQSRKASTGGM